MEFKEVTMIDMCCTKIGKPLSIIGLLEGPATVPELMSGLSQCPPLHHHHPQFM